MSEQPPAKPEARDAEAFPPQLKQWLDQALSRLDQKMNQQISNWSAALAEEAEAHLSHTLQRLEKQIGQTQSAAPGAPTAKPAGSQRDESHHLNDYGVQLFYQNQLDQAVQIIEEAVRVNPGLVEAWNNLGVIYTSIDQSEKAVHAFQMATELDPARVEVLNNQAVLALVDTQAEKALEILEQAHQAEPRQIAVLLNMAQAYQALGQHARAVHTWNLVLAIDPEQDEATRNLRQYFQ